MSNILNRKSIISTDLEEESPKRLVSAPTLYCVFALGTILIMVGTFITAHAYLSHHDSDYHLNVEHILRILGPILLGFGGVILFGISVTCLCVYKQNKSIRHLVTTDDFCNIGASTFYDQRHVFSDTIDLINSSANGQIEHGTDNLSHPTTQDDPITFLTKAVLHERRRKLSKNIPKVRSMQAFEAETSSNNSPTNESPLTDLQKREVSNKKCQPLQAHPSDYIELQNLKRAIPLESLAQSDDDGNESPQPISRQRFFSMTGQRPQFRKTENLENHRRIASLTQSARVARVEELRRRRKLNIVNEENKKIFYPPELSPSLSHKKKKKKNKLVSGANDQPEVHHLPGYSPEVIESLIEIADKQSFREPLQIDDNITYSSLQHHKQTKQLNKNGTRNIRDNEISSDKESNAKGSPSDHRNIDDMSLEETYKSRSYNIDESAVDMRRKSRSAIRNSEANFERNSLGVQTLKRNFENLSRQSQVSFKEFDDQVIKNVAKEVRTKSKKDMTNIKLQTSADNQYRSSYIDVENSPSFPPSPVSGSESSCSSCSSPPPSPTKASFTALNIMQDLCQETPIPQRNQKALSIISSQDECYETD